MSKLKAAETYTKNGEAFGERLARFRNDAGLSQRDLAAETGISQRVIAYYEGETEYAPAHLLPRFSKSLAVSIDALLGVEKIKSNNKIKDTRLWRRFKQIEKLSGKERKQIVQILDAFINQGKLLKGK